MVYQAHEQGWSQCNSDPAKGCYAKMYCCSPAFESQFASFMMITAEGGNENTGMNWSTFSILCRKVPILTVGWMVLRPLKKCVDERLSTKQYMVWLFIAYKVA